MTTLVICYSNLSKDPRVLRQIRYIAPSKVITAGYVSTSMDLPFVPLREHKGGILWKLWKFFMLIIRRDKDVYWNSSRKKDYKSLQEKDFDLIVANDLEALPLALKLASKKKGIKVIFDAHEYYPGTFQGNSFIANLLRGYVIRNCKNYLPRADHMTTVAKGIGDLYKIRFGVESSVIRNTNKYFELKPQPLDQNRVNLVHHGYALPMRKIEIMINLLDFLDTRFVLNFYLLPAPYFEGYYEEMKKLADSKGGRVVFHDPVPTDKIPEEINQYDMGIFFLPPTNENYANALPNKFFEFVQGRLMIAIGPSPEMAGFVRKYDLGLVSKNYSSKDIAKELNKISSDEIFRYKQNADKSAFELSEEVDKKVFKEILTKLTANARQSPVSSL